MNNFYFDMDSDLKQSVVRLSVNRLDPAQQVIFVRTGVNKNVKYYSESTEYNDTFSLAFTVCIHNNVSHYNSRV